MRVGELRRATGASLRALRYYEELGLVVPARSPNGYRDYEDIAVAQVAQIEQLSALGFAVSKTRPFLDCLASGHLEADECPAALAAYAEAIAALTARIDQLSAWRRAVTARLDTVAEASMSSPALPVPIEGSTMHLDATASVGLVGRNVPDVTLDCTDGSRVRLAADAPGRTVVYAYPLSGRPGVDLPSGWMTIPGARGCTVEACGFRDHHAELRDAGASAVYGLSSQPVAYQTELSERLGLPFAMLSDPQLVLARALGLPTFELGPMCLYQRLTLVLRAGTVEHVWWDVPDPASHALDVLAWLRDHSR